MDEGSSEETIVTWLQPEGGNMMQSKDLKTVADGNGEKHKTSVTTSVSSFFSSGGLISSAFSKASSGEHVIISFWVKTTNT